MKRAKLDWYKTPEEEAWRKEYMKRPFSSQEVVDPVQKMIRTCTPEEFLDWMRFRGDISPEQREDSSLLSNLRDVFLWQRLQGRLDMVAVTFEGRIITDLRQQVESLARKVDTDAKTR